MKYSLLDTLKYGFGVTCTYIRIFEIPIIILNVLTTRTQSGLVILLCDKNLI